MKQLKALEQDFLIVDGGNALFGSLPRRASKLQFNQALEKAKVIIASYNHMGYHAMAVGFNEIAMGLTRIKSLEKAMKFPFLCANLVNEETGAPLFQPTTIVTVKGVKIGLFGVLLGTIQKSFLKEALPGIKLTDPFEAGKQAAAKLRPDVDLVMGLCHTNDVTSRKLLAQCPDIDLVLDPQCTNGSYMIWVSEDEQLQWVNGKPLLRCDGQGSRLGRFDILMGSREKGFIPWDDLNQIREKQEDGGAISAAETALLDRAKTQLVGGTEVIEIFPHFAEAPEIKAMVEKFKKTTRFAAVAMETVKAQAKAQYLTAEGCMKCHKRNYKAWSKTHHGTAYSTLVETGDEFRYDCLPCHTLGYGETFIDAHKVGPYKNVQCESCHGTNPKHAEDPDKYPWPAVKMHQCIICHNPKHLGIPFSFKEKRLEVKSCRVKPPPEK